MKYLAILTTLLLTASTLSADETTDARLAAATLANAAEAEANEEAVAVGTINERFVAVELIASNYYAEYVSLLGTVWINEMRLMMLSQVALNDPVYAIARAEQDRAIELLESVQDSNGLGSYRSAMWKIEEAQFLIALFGPPAIPDAMNDLAEALEILSGMKAAILAGIVTDGLTASYLDYLETL